MSKIHIGTSGWHYKHWCGPFYERNTPAPKMLSCYFQFFDTVEINNSFYRLPSEQTFRAWRDAVPPHFCFAVKASRFLTHNKKLKDPENALRNFLPRAEVLKEKLGPILFQLPPAWRVNVDRLRDFLQALPKTHQYTFEFRELSWHTEPVYQVLREHNAAFCLFELAGFTSPMTITADFAYVRLHGPGGKYQGSYSQDVLKGWADRIASWSHLNAVYIYFDNDQSGYAAQNALELRRIIDSQGVTIPAPYEVPESPAK
jgi:uncharacterized protein YecE (DUF72 family)